MECGAAGHTLPLPGLWVPMPADWRVWDRWRAGMSYRSRKVDGVVMVRIDGRRR